MVTPILHPTHNHDRVCRVWTLYYSATSIQMIQPTRSTMCCVDRWTYKFNNTYYMMHKGTGMLYYTVYANDSFSSCLQNMLFYVFEIGGGQRPPIGHQATGVLGFMIVISNGLDLWVGPWNHNLYTHVCAWYWRSGFSAHRPPSVFSVNVTVPQPSFDLKILKITGPQCWLFELSK